MVKQRMVGFESNIGLWRTDAEPFTRRRQAVRLQTRAGGVMEEERYAMKIREAGEQMRSAEEEIGRAEAKKKWSTPGNGCGRGRGTRQPPPR